MKKKVHNSKRPVKDDSFRKGFLSDSRNKACSRVHAAEKSFECDFCGKTLTTRYGMKLHMRIHTGEEPYECNVCKKSFSQNGNLNLHLRTHTGEKPYECDVCKKTFSQKCSLNSHLRTHTGEKPYECDVCKKTFSQKCKLNFHLRTHTGEKPYECDVCKKAFSQKCKLNFHLRTHTGEKTFECDVCKKTFSQKDSLNFHLRTHTGEKPYECDVCKKTFSQKCNLNFHLRTHTGEKPYECEVCKKTFSEKYKLNFHLRTHTGEKPYECEVCKKTFSQKGNLNIHLRTHTGEKPYECDVCKKTFSQKNSLSFHLRTHTGEKPYECDVCKKTFSQKCSLNSHLRTHTGEKPYECDVCKKTFSQKYKLNFHLRTHTGEKPYECDVCKKTFSQKCSLNSHLRTHTGEKPYECDVCKKTFSQKCGLNLHLRTHAGEKPYECGVCKETFSRKDSLNFHLRTHTGEKPYECDVCRKTFSRKDSLNFHLRTHTGEKPYECDVCKKTFSVKSSLNSHLRTHAECDIYKKTFPQSSNLKAQIKIHSDKRPSQSDIMGVKFAKSRKAGRPSSVIGSGKKIVKDKYSITSRTNDRSESNGRSSQTNKPLEATRSHLSCNPDSVKSLSLGDTWQLLRSYKKKHEVGEQRSKNALRGCRKNALIGKKRMHSLKKETPRGKNNSRIVTDEKQEEILYPTESSECQGRCEDSQAVSNDEIAVSCIKERVLSGSDNGDNSYSAYAIESHDNEGCLVGSLSDVGVTAVCHSHDSSDNDVGRGSGDGRSLRSKTENVCHLRQQKSSLVIENVIDDNIDCQMTENVTDDFSNTLQNVSVCLKQQQLPLEDKESEHREERPLQHIKLDYVENNKVVSINKEDNKEANPSVAIADRTPIMHDMFHDGERRNSVSSSTDAEGTIPEFQCLQPDGILPMTANTGNDESLSSSLDLVTEKQSLSYEYDFVEEDNDYSLTNKNNSGESVNKSCNEGENSFSLGGHIIHVERTSQTDSNRHFHSIRYINPCIRKFFTFLEPSNDGDSILSSPLVKLQRRRWEIRPSVLAPHQRKLDREIVLANQYEFQVVDKWMRGEI